MLPGEIWIRGSKKKVERDKHLTVGLEHVGFKFAARACLTLGVDYAKALTGWNRRKGGWIDPEVSGVMVAREHAESVRTLAALYEQTAGMNRRIRAVREKHQTAVTA